MPLSGQPSVSSTPLKISGSSGHLSSVSSMPSLSLSGSGQPSASSKPSLSSGSQRAPVLGVEDAVLVVVRVGAAVGVLEAVLVLGLVGAPVVGVEDAVLVVVGLGAAVAVLEVVLVLGVVGAGVVSAQDPVLVRVQVHGRGLWRRRLLALEGVLVGQAPDHAHHRRADPLGQAEAHAEVGHQVVGQPVAHAGEQLQRDLLLVLLFGGDGPEEVGDHVELLPDVDPAPDGHGDLVVDGDLLGPPRREEALAVAEAVAHVERHAEAVGVVAADEVRREGHPVVTQQILVAARGEGEARGHGQGDPLLGQKAHLGHQPQVAQAPRERGAGRSAQGLQAVGALSQGHRQRQPQLQAVPQPDGQQQIGAELVVDQAVIEVVIRGVDQPQRLVGVVAAAASRWGSGAAAAAPPR